MTTYNTGNALGSSDARDLYDNAENLDRFANGAGNTYQDRLGVTRKSLAGMNAAFDSFIESSGYTVPVPYAAGINLTAYNQLVEYNDEFYKLKAGQAPYTTTGTWGTDSAKLVAVGDAALRQELAAGDGASKVGYQLAGGEARDVAGKLGEFVSILDFIPESEHAAIRAGTSTYDCTVAFNTCFEQARLKDETVHAPSGTYLVGGLLFGNQQTASQSDSPLGLIGDGWNTILKVKSGATKGLQSWSVAGVVFRDFCIDARGTSAQSWDCEWKPGAGPSTQCIIENVRVLGGSAATHVNLKNMNDTYPTKLVVVGTNHNQCGIDFTQPGGLGVLRDCIWAECYLKYGAQNGIIDSCWGHGILFAQGCTNYMSIEGGYLYANSHLNAVLKSESFSSFQSVRSLKCHATQFITDAGVAPSAYFDLNAYSTLDFDGCQWIGATSAMFGTSCRKDSFAPVKVKFTGGSVPSVLSINTPAGFIIDQDGIVDDGTGYNRRNKTNSIYASGGGSSEYASGSWYDFIPAGELEAGTYLIEWSWDHNGAGQPFIVGASAMITMLPLDSGAGESAPIPTNTSTYFAADGGQIHFRLVGTGSGHKIQFRWTDGALSGNLGAGGVMQWVAVKLC